MTSSPLDKEDFHFFYLLFYTLSVFGDYDVKQRKRFIKSTVEYVIGFIFKKIISMGHYITGVHSSNHSIRFAYNSVYNKKNEKQEDSEK